MRRIIYLFFKRIMDILVSLTGLIALSWLMILVALLIVCTSGFPIIFRQKRVGKKKKPFTIYKFRTMKKNTPNVPTRDFTNANNYITRVGKFLRKTSLDELPQLFNILFGKMSVIGPRPPQYSEEDLIAERDKYGASNVRPGVTGWAQVNGRDELARDPVKKAAYDGEYYAKLSFWFDAKIFFMTVWKVLFAKDVKEGAETKQTEVTAADLEKVEMLVKNNPPPEEHADENPMPENAAPDEKHEEQII